MIIDWQHHFSPEEIFKRRGGGKTGQALIRDGKVGMHIRDEVYQIDKHLEFMDAAGIDVAVLSATVNYVEDCRLTNDLYVRVMNEYPQRVVGLTPCIPTRGKEALEELKRAVNLGLKGVVISPQNDGLPLDSGELWPFYEYVSTLKIPIFVHITGFPIGYDALNAPYMLNVTMTREFDLAAATARLILGGVLVEFPELKFIMAHIGGGISSILERIERYIDTYQDRFWTEQGGSPPFNRPYKENFRKYFSSIYFDLAGFEGGMNAVECALTTISPQRLLFGTDYPYNFTNDPQGVMNYIESIRNLDLSTLATERILGGNAAELLGI